MSTNSPIVKFLRQRYINGQWVESTGGKPMDVIDTSNETVVTTITLRSEADTNADVAAARDAFIDWSETPKPKVKSD